MSDTPENKTSAGYCIEQMRSYDIDRYLSILLTPKKAQAHLFALYAFNLEIAKVRETVSEALLGEIRLTWWRESIEAIFHGDVSDHPVVEALERTVVECALPQKPLLDLIDARRFDVYDEPMETMAQFEAYCGATSSVLFQLAAHVVAGKEAASAATVCGHIGMAYALQGLLRSAPIHAARGQLFLPKETFVLHEADVSDYFGAKTTAPLKAVFQELHDIAHFHLAEAQDGLLDVTEKSFAALVPGTLISPYLAKFAATDFDPFAKPVQISQFKRQWKMWRGLQKRNFV